MTELEMLKFINADGIILKPQHDFTTETLSLFIGLTQFLYLT